MPQRRALVRHPSDRLPAGLVTHNGRQHIDVALANAQWERYVRALRDSGWEPIEVEPADDHPDSVFIEDAVVVYGDLAIITRPGAVERRGETVEAEAAVRRSGYSTVHITEPGTLDGGDVLKVGRTVWVGRGGRTNAEGIRQLTEYLEPLGATVIAVPVTKVLHLKSAVTALPDGTIIGYPPVVDDPDSFPSFLAALEEAGSHVVLLDNDTILMAESAPKTAEILRQRGYNVVVVDISEFEKLEGCVTCLSVRLRG